MRENFDSYFMKHTVEVFEKANTSDATNFLENYNKFIEFLNLSH